MKQLSLMVAMQANCFSHIAEESAQSSRETISLTGARTMVEGLFKRLPKVEWGEF